MSETKFHESVDGQVSFYDTEHVENTTQMDELSAQASSSDDQLKEAIETQMQKIARQNMLIGAQTICSVILQKIISAMNKPGKRTMNDYKRIIKDVQKFCEVGLSRKVNADGETEPVEENSTKLMEEANEGNIN